MNNILLWGGKSRALIIHNYLENINSLNKKFLEKKLKKEINIKYIFDKFIKKINFKSKAEFSNKTSNLKKYIKHSNYFIVCIGNNHGMARFLISKKLVNILDVIFMKLPKLVGDDVNLSIRIANQIGKKLVLALIQYDSVHPHTIPFILPFTISAAITISDD